MTASPSLVQVFFGYADEFKKDTLQAPKSIIPYSENLSDSGVVYRGIQATLRLQDPSRLHI